MGSGLSAYSNEIIDMLATAKVITIDGSLREYSVPTKVSEILDEMNTDSFLCSSDELYLDRDIPALSSHDWVELDQIYFILPRSMVDHPLKGQDMAALAVKASLALDGALEKKRAGSSGGKRGVQVVPIRGLGEKLDETCKTGNDLKKSEQFTRNTLMRNSKTKLGGRASVRDGHNMPKLAAIQE
ncbi:poly polymerase [Carex rostrata]